MNTDTNNHNSYSDYAAFIAIDWADQQHVFSLKAADQTKKETGTLEQKPEIIGLWVAKLQERFGGRPVAVALEQSRGALIHALDTDQILEILTKHLDLLKPINPDTPETRLLGRLVQDRRKAVDLRTSHIQACLAGLKEYFPQAIELVNGNLSSRLACDFLMKWPTFEAFQQAKPSTLKRFYYGHNIRSPEVIQKVLNLATTAKALTTDPAIVESGSRLSQMYAQLIQTLNPVIEDYDQRIKKVFHDHPEAPLFSKLPGAGPALAPRLLAAFGTDRSRYETAGSVQTFSGISPVTRSSGKTRFVYFRHACPKFLRQTFHEFARLSLPKCQWARNYVEYYTGKGKKYHTIIRALAFKWIRILFGCWKHRKPYDDDQYMQILKKRGSRFC